MGGILACVADGRGWKYLSVAKFWPISAEPTVFSPTMTRLPLAGAA